MKGKRTTKWPSWGSNPDLSHYKSRPEIVTSAINYSLKYFQPRWQLAVHSAFHCMKILRIMLLSLDGILFHRGQHPVGFFDSSLETNFTLLVKKGTVTLKCLSLPYLKLTLPRLKRHILIWNPVSWPSDHSGTSRPSVYSVKMRNRMKFDLSFTWTLLMADARSQWSFRGKETNETPPCAFHPVTRSVPIITRLRNSLLVLLGRTSSR